MRILVTSRANPHSGSWKIRGEQLGNAIGADVVLGATIKMQQQYDRVIHVKRCGLVNPGNSILDIVDAWPQPTGNRWSFGHLKQWGEVYVKPFRACVAATEWMQKDLSTAFWLRHHHLPDIEENPIRGKVKAVGYEGSAKYLSGWEREILDQCNRRGWAFLVNPTRLSDCDIILGVRGDEWRGYSTDNWKSCVKLSNAIGSLTPFIGLPEKGYLETGAPFEQVTAPNDLSRAFDAMSDLGYRVGIAEEYKRLKGHFSLERVAQEYREWLTHTRF